ncbi:MAG: cadmium-translocating P-type ATPase [Sphingopyxis sp.]|nr:cadmium-translocating P-type ATPase [Sphingopyxis sp.]
MVVTRFSVPGMRCAGCIAKIENTLPLTRGIAHARANFTARQVAVTHLATMTLPDVLAAFAAVGFPAQPLAEASDAPDRESKALVRALAVAGFAMMNIMLLSVSVWSGASGATRDLFHWLSALIALPTVAYAGQPFFRSAWSALSVRRTNMDVPISIGVILTTGMSLYETATGGHHAYFDGAVMLLFFLLVGRWLDSVMRLRARDGVAALLKHNPSGALVVSDDGRSQWLQVDALVPGMIMVVAAGERLAADGRVVAGDSRVDQALLTGESLPIATTVGALVHAGTLNVDAPIRVEVVATGDHTVIADIARMMEAAAQGKSRYVRIADRAARLYAPAVHTLALLTFAGWMLVGAGWHQSLLVAVAVLIITCPCALGLAVPAAQIVAAGALMRGGVLVKDGSALERLAEVDRVLFDKTGTLTLGRPVPKNLAAAAKVDLPVLLALAQASRHPLSLSIREALEKLGVAAERLSDVTEIAGQGVVGHVAGQLVSLGRGPCIDNSSDQSCCFRAPSGESITLRFADVLRPAAVDSVAALDTLGIAGAIASGDRAASVAPIAAAVGLTAQTAMSPQDKMDAIHRLSGAGHRVLMVGDGLNDGPALAAGHASVAPASASDAGQNAADAVFMGDSLAPLPRLIRTARATQRVIRQNFGLAIGYNLIAVPLAMAGLVTPLIAALAMSGSSIIVVANALRLSRAS